MEQVAQITPHPLDAVLAKLLALTLCAAIFSPTWPVIKWLLVKTFELLIFLTMGLVVLTGTALEIPYMKKMQRGELPYRLPFSYRIAGWRLGPAPRGDGGLWKDSLVIDTKQNKFIAIHKRTG